MKKVYLICAGNVISKNDSQRHYVNVEELARLYNVKRSDCVNFMSPSEKHSLTSNVKIIELKPRFDGNYQLPN